jgi:predicted acylesterase/phospholipase RssA
MTADKSKKIIHYRDLFVGDFWRYFVRAAWLFFPAILFLVFAYLAFWSLSQGKDLMIITLENRKVFGLFLLALVFWVVTTWYTTRMVAKAKELQDSDKHLMWQTLRIQGPRILAFTCITIIILAFFQLPYPETPQLSRMVCYILLFLSFSWYFIIYQLCNRLLQRNDLPVEKQLRFWQKARFVNYALVLLLTLLVILTKWIWGLIILLLWYQTAFIVFVLIRRNIIDAKGYYSTPEGEKYEFTNRKVKVWKKLYRLVTDNEDRRYFQAFTTIGFIATGVYIGAITSVKFSTWMGSFPFVFLAFGVLLAIGNFITIFSIVIRFNFHLLLLALSFIIGYYVEPHYTRLVKNETGISFNNRQNLKEYFYQWINDPARRQMLMDSSVKKVPIYFVMANGGASRSGYWTASVLSKMEDETNGEFSKHLFCLSGASGGSVGNATFFSVLRSKESLQKNITTPNACWQASSNYLKSDFLTYTLARTLGPDVFRNLVTLYNVNDRASALSLSIEKAAGEKNFLYDSLGVSMSAIVTQQNVNYNLPVLCINTTRMQDGNPAVISNIKITDSVFNGRVDVLGLLKKNEDMKLSTAVVLGASFPYLSPAGRIDYKKCDTCKSEPNYFVDGGYFDNSGAGVVFEMMVNLQKMLAADTSIPNKNKLEFNILHITNDNIDEVPLESVNPLTNDLAAPFKTLLGAYDRQTSVNDLRLRNFISNLYPDGKHYHKISLYVKKDPVNYAMNWVISKHVLQAIDRRLASEAQVTEIIASLKALKGKSN